MMPGMRNDLPEIKVALQARIADLCGQLLPGGRLEGGQWVCHNPQYAEAARKDRTFKVRISGGVAGAWIDWRSGDKGDVIGLIAFCNRSNMGDAMKWARDWLGISRMDAATRSRLARDAATMRRRAEDDDARIRAKKIADAQALFNEARPGNLLGFSKDGGPDCDGPWHGPEALAINYFSARGCPLQEVKGLAYANFRFSPDTEWWKGAKYERRAGRDGQSYMVKTVDGPRFPAFHSAMRNRSGALTACHVTWLDPIRPVKAGVEKPKLMRGIAQGAVIELATGPEGVDFWKAETPHPLVIGEGIETVASIGAAIDGQARLWAAGSLSGIANAPVDLDCIGKIIFARDNNDGNAQAQRQFNAALEWLEASGRPVTVIASHVGDDFNDLAQGEDG
jgi:hypothetical protein